MTGGEVADARVCEIARQQLKLGQRVSSLNTEKGPQLGSVKFVGIVNGFKGIWVGVDWDSGQGRHNGVVDGVRYFDTVGEKSGSFVRPHTLSTGVSLLDALTSKYRASSNRKDEPDEEMYVLSTGKKRQTKVPVLLVGKKQVEDRQGQLGILRLAALTYAGVCCAGPAGHIRDVAPSIEELDLTGNLLPDWHEVKRICDELPALRILELSCSRFPFAAAAKPLLVSSNLTGVALNHCGLTWSQVDILKHYLPNIQDLSLIGNCISNFKDGNEDAGGFVQGLQTLRLLNLDDNYLEDWQEVMKLSKLPSLAKLCLNGNRLTLVEYLARSGDRNSTSLPFVSLLCLYLGRNNLADWSSVDALDWFPSLQDVRLSDNPLTDHKTGTATRFMLIARMGSLSCLNGSLIKPRERRDSEIRYVRHVLQTMRTQSKERIIKSHPRFEKLRMIHDLPEDIWSSGYINTANSDSFANNFFAVTIECVAAGVGECASITKKLPLATTIGKLKVVCESLFKLPSNQQRLYFKDQDSPIPIELKDDLETLADVGIGPGRIIILDEI
ncbi:tubulin-folding cofactor E isoform X1 [Physcomitrium patens]|uniref:tubulin-folding cofactor E isoform X1 n=1 Tax=Physcomitrium patens TaxID=3218 RepID=UPI000D15C25D|nr:tubulin-folding cofactor E-like isoform X1 [Physcomitrium patens]XP_024384283.1 tubulin-folding cofactor E-like isoform X1 [Physcomitrium patens]|eukprot:XP_024384282.1 tubulin-folding cofactor E-like isoform X1 [Physcomitrella patens]